ncbi:regulator of Vps4 activity in the MVB pathway-domain-containing protein, partial [Aspergillus karnatakaensis]|uniref:regulator of Vps4 activity in the MVB pathway-domain-containing protein n=1 Tax=Aspergillus karnatakaensis TaxID=1810916 RepID=UPI003CCCC2D3
MPPTPQTAKLTSTLHLLIPRLRLLQKKSTASSVIQRRELAQLLENNRDASARIRVENVIATDIAIEVMEMVELYCELLLARAGVLDQLGFGEAGKSVKLRV